MNLPKIPKSISPSKDSNVMIVDETQNIIATTWLLNSEGDRQEFRKELCSRYNEHDNLKSTTKLAAWFGAIATVIACALFTYLQCNPPR